MRSLWIVALAGGLLARAQVPVNETGARLSQARTDLANGDVARARVEAEALHSANPTDPKIAVLLADCYIRMGREAEARTLLAPLEAANQADMELEYSLAFAQLQSGETADGVARMERVAQATQSANAFTVAGAARLSRKEFEQAKPDLDAAIALNASLPELYSMAGEVRFALGDAEAAFPFFEKALRVNPRDFNANLYAGMYRLTKGDYDSARPLLELALQLQPASPLARLKVAELDSMTGKNSEAVSELETLEKANPDWVEPHIKLSVLYYKLHRPEDGQRERTIVDQIQAKQQQAGPSK